MPYKYKERKHQYYLDNREKLRAGNKVWQQTHPDEMREFARRNQHKLRLAALTYYSSGELKCRCCGDKHLEFLAIDHIGGGGNRQRKELLLGRRFYQWLKNNNYPTGYRVLCHNCNQSLGAYGYCPHGGLLES